MVLDCVRDLFPSLRPAGLAIPPIFLDGPGGTQVPTPVIEAMVDYLRRCNANHGGPFTTSRLSDAILEKAHQAVADFLNAPSADEIVFGQNMTSLTFHLSRALARTWRPGDEVVVTRLDHDANVSPWVLAARDAGATIRKVDIHQEDCTLDMEDLRRQLTDRTRLVAVTCASNAVGSRTDVKQVAALAHAVGALVFLDAVHYAPHGPVDVQDWGCDFLACSAYKFFGPHVGILWGRRTHLESLPTYKVRPAPETLPGRWMTGTQNHEGIAGVLAAMEYLASLGPGDGGRRAALLGAMHRIDRHEADLGWRLLKGLKEMPAYRIWGISDPNQLSRRVPTISITHAHVPAPSLSEQLAAKEIYAWAGNFYALELTERLGLESRGGLLRLGLVHYNTAQEVDRVLEALDAVN